MNNDDASEKLRFGGPTAARFLRHDRAGYLRQLLAEIPGCGNRTTEIQCCKIVIRRARPSPIAPAVWVSGNEQL